MTTGATGQLGLALPVQGELSGTWGDTVNNGITQYTNIAIAATLTLTNDGAVTLANTTGDASASNITSSLTGAGTVTAQFAIVKVTGTLTTAKVVTGPSYSKTYVVVNAATGGIVTFKASGQTGVSIAVGESAWVYYNGTDYVKIASTTSGSAGGSNTQVQYNSSGALAGSSAFTFDGAQISVNGITVGRGAGAVSTNTAVGASALAANTTGSRSVAFGDNALLVNTTGERLVAIGSEALTANTTGSYNTAVGWRAAQTNTSGEYNTALGHTSLTQNTTGANNVALGSQSLFSNTTASYNTAVGYQALYTSTVNPESVAVGTQAFYAATGGYSTAVGYRAGYSQTTGDANTYIGRFVAGSSAATTGSTNTGVGNRAIQSLTSGSNNTAVGASALQANTTGGTNVAVGQDALYANTTASQNTAVGYQAGYSNTTGANLVALGYQAGYSSNANNNTFIGYYAGQGTTGTLNTFVGVNGVGYLVSSGTKNTIIGGYSGNQGGLDIRTASNYVVLSDGDGNPRMYFDGNGIANLKSSMLEQMTISATAATGTINFDAVTQSVLYYTTNASGNFTMNIRGNSGTTLNNSMVTGQSLTVAFLCTNGSTAYYQSAMTIDGSSVTPKWQGGTAPTTGNASAIDSYVYTIIKTASATFTVLASQTKFA